MTVVCKLFEHGHQERAVLMKEKRWPVGYVIKVKFLDGEPWQHAWVEKIVTESVVPLIHSSLSVKFVDKSEFADVRITFKFEGGYGTSLIGTDARTISQSEPSMKLNKLDNPATFSWKGQTYSPGANVQTDEAGYVVKHEWSHVFSFLHEHLNPHHTNPIQWNVEEVYKYYGTGDGAWPVDVINANILDRAARNHSEFTPFDSESITLYTFPKQLTKNGVEFALNTQYSAMDKKFLKEQSVDPNTLTTNRALLFQEEKLNQGISMGQWAVLLVISLASLVILFLLVRRVYK